LLTGDLPIWETSEKTYQVNLKQFLLKEKSAAWSFVQSKDLFIHEFWKIFKKNFEFGVAGISFTGKARNGKDINYGYVDAKDVIDLLKSRNIPTNVNGAASLTYWDAIHTKKYPFNLVQFGKNDFKQDKLLSFYLKEQAINDPKIHRSLVEVAIDKEIEYRVIKPNITSNEENEVLFNSLTKVINNNKQTILNAGGDEYFSHLMFVPWKINDIIITEHWTKYKNIPFQELKSVMLFVDGHPITLDNNQLQELNAKVNLQGIEEYLSEKSFDFVLQRINSEEFLPSRSEDYYKALLTKNWKYIKN
jgi:hypothetical protein